jgi:hypothetical protein
MKSVRGRIESVPLSGLLRWPHDDFFRPTVGIFLNDTLVAAAPTFRTPVSIGFGRTDWLCAYDAREAVSRLQAPPEAVALTCLETAELISADNKPQFESSLQPKSRLDVDDLLKLGRLKRRPLDATGFTQFLQLSIVDQIQLLYIDFLRRDADPAAFSIRIERALEGQLNILDLRDELVRSEEFRRTHRTLDERLGDWMVWGGLELASAFLTPTAQIEKSGAQEGAHWARADSPFVSYLELISRRESIGEHLATMALGRNSNAETRRRWLKQHRTQLNALGRLTSKRHSARASRSQTSPDPYQFKGLLASALIGPAGRRTKKLVHSIGGKAGHILFGPYILLPAGGYQLFASVRSRSVNKTVKGLFALEVTYQGLFLARREIAEPFTSDAPLSLEFSLPPRIAALLSEGWFETRVWTNGAADIQIDALDLRRLSREATRPTTVELLSLMTVGGAGRRTDEGYISSPAHTDGHAFFGPYSALLPGTYRLWIVCRQTGAAPLRGVVMLDVISAQIPTIASERFVLSGREMKLLLQFSIPEAPSVRQFPDRVEFRLEKHQPTSFVVHSIELQRLAR